MRGRLDTYLSFPYPRDGPCRVLGAERAEHRKASPGSWFELLRGGNTTTQISLQGSKGYTAFDVRPIPVPLTRPHDPSGKHQHPFPLSHNSQNNPTPIMKTYTAALLTSVAASLV